MIGKMKLQRYVETKSCTALDVRPSLQERERKAKSLVFTLLEEVSNILEMFSLETEDLGEGKSMIISTGQFSHVVKSFLFPPQYTGLRTHMEVRM